MVRTLSISLPQLALALLGPGAYLYHCRSRGGYWKAVAPIGYARTEHDHPDPYAALAAAAALQLEATQRHAEENAAARARDPEARYANWYAAAGCPAAYPAPGSPARAALAASAAAVAAATSDHDDHDDRDNRDHDRETADYYDRQDQHDDDDHADEYDEPDPQEEALGDFYAQAYD